MDDAYKNIRDILNDATPEQLDWLLSQIENKESLEKLKQIIKEMSR